jgi:hypothetical protein
VRASRRPCEGWYIASASVSGVELTLTPVYPEADFQVTVIYAYIIDGKTLYIPYDMWLCDKTEIGMSLAYAKKPNYVILAISPTMRKGWVDYKLRAFILSIATYDSFVQTVGRPIRTRIHGKVG